MRHLSVKSSPGEQLQRTARAALVLSVCLFACCSGVQAAGPALNSVIEGVEKRYNHAQTLSVDFTETYSIAGRDKRPESGNLLLRKPGKMRWTYARPSGKLFVSDGKTAYLYTAQDNRVERSSLKNSEDMRAPMAFLLGKLDMKKEFRHFETRPGDGGQWLTGDAANDRLPYEKVEMLIGTDYSIRQLTVSGRDGSNLHFVFENEQVNPAVADSSFQFAIPADAEVIDAVKTSSGEN
jgi:outer membrane lipoprotein carrier protein